MPKGWNWSDWKYSWIKWVLWGTQGLLSSLGLVFFFWTLTAYLKIRYWGKNPLGLYPWAYIFYRPVEGHLLNYLVVCLALSLAGLLIYLGKNRLSLGRLQEKMVQTRLGIQIFVLFLSIFLLVTCFQSTSLALRMAGTFVVLGLPFMILFYPRFALQESPKANRWFTFGTFLLLVLVSVEPIRWVRGPVYLMNEYLEIYGETLIQGEKVSNDEFLKTIKPTDIGTIKAFYEARNRIDGLPPQPLKSRERQDFFRKYKSFQVSMAQDYLETLIDISRPEDLQFLGEGFQEVGAYLPNLKSIDIERIRDFYSANLLETLHQTMGRGQMNHIGHILNPINEFELGKPLADIYFQYGIGYTFLLKWIMERVGGVSVENYYKTYVLYVVYFLSFLFMVLLLFPDRRYAFAAFAILPVCFYFLGYIPFVLAPGVLPSLHLLDVPVILLLFFFFRRRRSPYAIAAAILAMSSLWINRNFGVALSIAVLVSLLLHALEVEGGERRVAWILGIFLFLLGTIFSFAISDVGAGKKVFPYYLYGFYSWPAYRAVIGGTLLYLIFSYFFIIWLRGDRSPGKYLYLFVFIYSQIALAYYFWSGLINHLPPVFPFVWLQFLLTLDLFRKKMAGKGNSWDAVISGGIQAAVILTAGCFLFFGLRFYSEKKWFQENFEDHTAYQWTFDRAKLISTIPPRIIQDSVDLIRKYSSEERPGIYIISRYDGLLPFLAQRYSGMPFFEMISFVFSKKERDQAIQTIQDQKPVYLFADRSIILPMEDRWSVLYQSEFIKKERASHYGRHKVLREIFEAICKDYERIEEGGLLSAYRRKSSS